MREATGEFTIKGSANEPRFMERVNKLMNAAFSPSAIRLSVGTELGDSFIIPDGMYYVMQIHVYKGIIESPLARSDAMEVRVELRYAGPS